MSSTLRKLCRFALAILVMIIISCGHAFSAGSFQATLDTAPSDISSYDDPPDQFSVALSPRTHAYLSESLKRRPDSVLSNFQTKSLTFNTVYYKRGDYVRLMVPVSVDADQFLSYRTRKATSDGFRQLTTRSMTNPDDERARRGLGVSLALPKRLDRMFGEGGAGLTVTGYRRITFSGRSQWTDAANTDTYQASKFPSLNMEQVSRFEIEGTIGSKISVRVSQDSQTDIPLSNRIQIRYKGDDDDILKTVEAGNTTLSLPNTRFVGYSSNIRGLFGIKTEAQVGALKLTAIASQEKGTSESASFSPTGEENADDIRDYEYVRGRIFDLGLPGELDSADFVVSLLVYEQENRKDNLDASPAIMWVDPNDTSSYTSEAIHGIRVKQLEDTQYELQNDIQRGLHYVHFNSSRTQGRALGIWMKVLRASTGDTITIGDISGKTLALKLIRHNVPVKDHKTWNLMWRNCYNMPRGVKIEDLNIKVYKGLFGSEKTSSVFDYQESGGKTQSYLEILGLDQYNSSDQKYADGRVDNLEQIYRPDWGLLIFPEREPFNSSRTFADANDRVTQELAVTVPDIYLYTDRSMTDASQYFIRVATMSRSSIIHLRSPNIIEGSERVTVGGNPLQKGVDYNIDYSFGQITLLSSAATDPNADISIDYEYAPFMTIQKKTLLGMRAEYEYSKDFRFGGTILYKSDKAQERKPRVGQETAKMVVYDLDATLALHPNFLTKAIDALPLIETESPSRLTIAGEIAQSRPNPNVEGIAYVDDFESALDQLSLGTSRTSWQLASEPVQLDEEPWEFVRGKILWHKPRHMVKVTDVYDREAKQGEGTIRTFRMIFRPSDSGNNTASWGGITRYFHRRVDSKRVQLFEIRAKAGDCRSKLHFDFGRISEDIDDDLAADSEDRNLNGAVDEDEDVGLDGLRDQYEPDWDPVTNPDPSGDNWYFLGKGKCPLPSGECYDEDDAIWEDESVRYEWLNGTEGNLNEFSALGRPDEEALSSNGFETSNSYFSASIDFTETDSPYKVVGSDRNGWVTYRIPIREALAVDTVTAEGAPLPDWSQITHVRVWFEAEPGQIEWDTVEVATWHFVQSNWQDSVICSPYTLDYSDEQKTKFVVASVSEEDGTFIPPFGVEAYKDPTTNVTEAQRGLLLMFSNLNRYDTCLATKELLTVDKYSGYRRLEMYVYGGQGIDEAPEGEQQQIRFFFRIGRDANNFYEYRTFIYPGWNPKNFVDFDFNAVTAFKDSLIRAAPKGKQHEIDSCSGVYRAKGNPNLNEIRYFAAGVVNPNGEEIGGPSGEIWLDELRVTDVRKDVGTAGRIAINGNLADLFTYSFGLTSQNPYFRKVSAATRGGSDNNLGSGKTTTSYNYSLSLKFDRLIPRSWGASIPVSYSYSKSTSTPLLRNNSDIVLPPEIRKQEETVSETRNLTVSESFRHKGKNLLFSLLLNRLNNSVSYRRNSSRSVNTPYSFGENISVKSGFDLGISKVPTLPIFFWTKPIPLARMTSESRLSLYPGTWKLSSTFTRNVTISDDKNYNRLSSLKRNLTGHMTISYDVFDNLSTSFRIDTKRDLSDLDSVNVSFRNLKLGLETHFGQSFDANYDPKLLGFLTTGFSYSASYSDDYDRSSKSRRSTMSRSCGVNGKFDHISFLGGKKKSSGRQQRGRRSSPRSGKDDDTTKKDGDRPFYDPPLAVLRYLTGWIKAPTYSYSKNFKNSVPGMEQRPSWKYRFGLELETDVPTKMQSRRPSSGEGEKYSASTGFTLLGGLSTDVKFSRSIERDLVRQGTRHEDIRTSWPDLSIRIQRFTTLPLIKPVVNKFIEVFAPRTGYSRSTREQIDLDQGFTTSKSTSIKHSPLLEMNFKLFRKLSLSGTYTCSRDESEKFNPSSGAPEKVTRSSKKSIAFTSGYSFSSPGGIAIPILGRLKFQSTLSIQLNVKINASKSETSTRGGPFVTSSDKSDFSWSTSMKYTFSQSLNANLTARWQDSNDNYRNRKSHVRELRISIELRF